MEMLPTPVTFGYFMDTQTVGVLCLQEWWLFFFKHKVNPLTSPLKNESLKIGPV